MEDDQEEVQRRYLGQGLVIAASFTIRCEGRPEGLLCLAGRRFPVLEAVDVGIQCIDCYEAAAGAEAVAQMRALAEPLRGVRILHLNATPYGGGVAEILRSEVPLLRDLGLAAEWKIITGDETFFRVTKTIHNGLQGAKRALSPQEEEIYLTNSTRNAKLLEEEYDLVIVHDPQPLALLELHGKGRAKWIWRCHIDTSEPNAEVWSFLRRTWFPMTRRSSL